MRPYTIFCDIDGTLVKKDDPIDNQYPNHKLTLLAGTATELMKWDQNGAYIILTTGRKESFREVTIKQLAEVGIFYDHLLMGIGGGTRILINDLKENSSKRTAIGITVERNEGISGIYDDLEEKKYG